MLSSREIEHVRTQNIMQRPQVDLAVKRRLKRVWVSICVFYVKYSALVGPTNLQILTTLSLIASPVLKE